MDVTSVTPRLTRMVTLGLGTAAGLVFALPVKTGSVACPPAQEGRTYCLLQHAYAPAAIKLAATILATWLLADFLLVRLPAMLSRWRSGERPARRSSDRGREAVLSDPVLAAANWGIVPEQRMGSWHAVKPVHNAVAAAALPEPSFIVPAAAPAPVAAPVPVMAAPEPDPVAVESPAPLGPIHALTTAERASRPAAQRLRVLGDDESRCRRLRRGNDPALVVSCWSDASSARELPDEITSALTTA